MGWTKEQNQAIKKEGSNILVSAAAGSGKTSVLVERIINKIVNEKIDIDKILVVTFTNAAASEMKQRILNALYKKIEENPDSENLHKQILLINRANISTIHSFCLNVIRNNFFELGMSANFRVGDTTEIEIMKQEAIEKIFEDKYEINDKNFLELLDKYTTYRDDQPLKDLIIKTYEFSDYMPLPNKWLCDATNEFNIDVADFADTKWGKIILQNAKDKIDDCILSLETVKNKISGIVDLVDFSTLINEDINDLKQINFENWDDCYNRIQQKIWNSWPRKSKLTEEEKELKENAKAIRDDTKEVFTKDVSKLICYNSKDAISDVKDMYFTMQSIKDLSLQFEEEFEKKKREKNIIDFSDIEHLALKLLIDENGNPTEIAKKYEFNEIMIDEYQDSNLIQEKILNSISNGKNIFMVGDVKQSIYRFRQARPDLFLKKYNNYEKVIDNINKDNGQIVNIEKDNNVNNMENNLQDEINQNDKSNFESITDQRTDNKITNDTKILLYNNFRSRKNVLNLTNAIFQNIMSKELGEIEYNEQEYLNYSADFDQPKFDCKTEIYVIDTEKKSEGNNLEIIQQSSENGKKLSEEIIKHDKENISQDSIEEDNSEIQNDDEEIVENNVLEARLAATKIKELVGQGAKYKDIAILLKSPGPVASIYEKELIENDIPIYSDSTSEYLESIEIDTIISLLKIIDNPYQDIPLVTVLRSPIGGFTDNELVKIRMQDRESAFYKALEKSLIQNYDIEQEKTEIKNCNFEEEKMEKGSYNFEEENIGNFEEENKKIKFDNSLKSKVQNFINMLDDFRKAQRNLPLEELIWKIYSDTGYYHYVRLMPNGKLRQANLKKLFEKAKDYEKISFKGLFNFIIFIEKIAKQPSNDMTSAKIIGENDDVVRLMSIHKSKGLEFPIVILCGAEKKINMQDMNEKIIYDQDLGIGVNYIKGGVEYSTLSKEAIKIKIKKESISENMRILYVALTRAKEKLIIIAAEKNAQKNYAKKNEELEKYGDLKKEKISSKIIEKYTRFIDWIELVYLKPNVASETNASLKILQREEVKTNNEKKIEKIEISKALENQEINIEKYNEIDKKLNWKYKYESSINLLSKTSVSALKRNANKLSEEDKVISLHNENNLESNFTDDIGNRLELSYINYEENDNNQNDNFNLNFDCNPLGRNKKLDFHKLVDFNQEEKIDSANRGTLIHLALQNLKIKKTTNQNNKNAIRKDYELEKMIISKNECNDNKLDNEKIVNEMIDGLSISKIEKEELIKSKDIIISYMNSKLFEMLITAKEVHKEAPFYLNIKACEINSLEIKNKESLLKENKDYIQYEKDSNIELCNSKDIASENAQNNSINEDKILVQGVIDLYFITDDDKLILVDYKTDNAKTEKEFKENYELQLELYKRALEKSLKRKVDNKYIYSTKFNKLIEI